jgi:hypothetical protein
VEFLYPLEVDRRHDADAQIDQTGDVDGFADDRAV